MSNNNYIKIFSGSFVVVSLALDRLKDIGIKGIVRDESESARLAGFGASIQNFQELYVHEDELDRAIPIINKVKSQTKAD